MSFALLTVAFVVIAFLSWAAVAAMRVAAAWLNLVDVPNERSSHLLPVPLGGGVALVAINLAAWIGFAVHHDGVTVGHAVVFIVGASLVAAVSLVDDFGHVRYSIRLLVQTVAALIFVIGYAPFDLVSLPAIGAVSLGALGVVLTLLWIVGLTNSYNFMDGIDGMVGGQTVAAGIGWVMVGVLTGRSLLIGLGLCLAASSIGFLLHNWHPARIFMGDVGSTFLGYTFAAITVVAAHNDPKLALAGVLLVWPSIFDPGFTVLRRLQQRQNIFVGHRSFLFHRLVATGWSHAAASTLYVPLPVLGAFIAVTWAAGSRPLHVAVVVAIATACLSLWAFVRYQEQVRGVGELATEALLEGAPESVLAVASIPEPVTVKAS